MNAFPFSICFLVPDFTIFSFVRNLCMPHVQRTGSKFPATEVKFVVVVDLRFSHFFFIPYDVNGVCDGRWPVPIFNLVLAILPSSKIDLIVNYKILK